MELPEPNPSVTSANDSPVYTVPEVAQLLRTSEWSVYEMIKRGELPGVIRIGSQIRIVRQRFREWIGVDPEPPAPAVGS
jgi:excisionase family DNA binding protein